MTTRALWGLTIALLLLLGVSGAWAREWDPDYERQVGQQALEQVLKQYELWENPEQQQRLTEMANYLRVYTQRPEVEYRIYLLDTEEANAFSLPDSIICVTRGLIEEVHSEHELIGVVAHEMAHNCTYDALDQAQRAQRISTPIMAAVIFTMLTGKSSEVVSQTLMAGLYVAHGVMSHYSIKVERRADENGLLYLLQTDRYNPVGLLTFMERLAVEERRRPPITLGIFQTHPFSTERVTALTDQLRVARVDINRRAVTKWDPPELAETTVGERPARTLRLWGRDVFSFNWAPEGSDPAQRGAAMAETLTNLLAAGAEGWDFWVETDATGASLKARGQTVLRVYPADVTLVGGDSPQQVAQQVLTELDAAFFAERLQRRY